MSSGIACILIFANLVILIPETVPNIKHSPIKVEGVFMAFGTITFAFCGHTVFPTIQHDMLDRSKFSNVIILGYVGKYDFSNRTVRVESMMLTVLLSLSLIRE